MLNKLEPQAQSSKILVQDPLRLLPEANGIIHAFARDNGFTVIVATTNLVFRDLYEKALADHSARKLLVIDRAPPKRRTAGAGSQAPAPLYPDLLDEVPPAARIRIDLQQFLTDQTGDPLWPAEVNLPPYSRLLIRYLPDVLRAHQNLRTADPNRFNNNDLKTILAFAALGIAESAFKKLDASVYWRIGLMGHAVMEELEPVVPEITRTIRQALKTAPAPFCWFNGQNTETVLKAFYLALILSQHFEYWELLMVNVDPALAGLNRIEPSILKQAPDLIRMDMVQAERDQLAVEASLTSANLKMLLIDSIDIRHPKDAARLIQKEQYSSLLRSLALLMVLGDLLTKNPDKDSHNALYGYLFPDSEKSPISFVEKRQSTTWDQLKEAYWLLSGIRKLEAVLAQFEKELAVLPAEKLNFELFWSRWNKDRLNRLEYCLSALERLTVSGDLLPRAESDLPSAFVNALVDIRERTRQLAEKLLNRIEALNRRFQDLVALQYPRWVQGDTEVRLTSQFLERCLKPHWDPQSQPAVLLIFDGLRYDIWDEMLRPMLETRLATLAEYPAASILPTETHFTRKAISAGTFPDAFNSREGENKLLQHGLTSLYGSKFTVQVVEPDGGGVGETVRYRAGNLEVYIFELCDKELHKIGMKVLQDGRQVPARPLSFIYQQHIKNIIETEVMAIVRGLEAGTRVFITADHGFARVGRQPIWFDENDLNDSMDCRYLHCFLKVAPGKARLKPDFRKNTITFTPQQLRMPQSETIFKKKTRQAYEKHYESIVFPKTGFSFSRKGFPYNPDAYSHGGISLQEMMIPMVVLEVKSKEEGAIALAAIQGPDETVEGETVEFRLLLNRVDSGASKAGDIRVDVSAFLRHKNHQSPLSDQVLFVSAAGAEVVYRLSPDSTDAEKDEINQGQMTRILTISVRYREGHRIIQKTSTHSFTTRLNPEKLVRRVPASLGKILGLTPKSMR